MSNDVFTYTHAVDCLHVGSDGAVLEYQEIDINIEREFDGRVRIVGVSLLDKMRQDPRQFYEFICKGWRCPQCSGFCSEEKEILLVCRHCEGPRPE